MNSRVLQSTQGASTFVANYESSFLIMWMRQPIRAPHYAHACSSALWVDCTLLLVESVPRASRKFIFCIKLLIPTPPFGAHSKYCMRRKRVLELINCHIWPNSFITFFSNTTSSSKMFWLKIFRQLPLCTSSYFYSEITNKCFTWIFWFIAF